MIPNLEDLNEVEMKALQSRDRGMKMGLRTRAGRGRR